MALTKESLNNNAQESPNDSNWPIHGPAKHISAKSLRAYVEQQLKLPSLPLPTLPQPNLSKPLEPQAVVNTDEHPGLPISLVSGELSFQVTDFSIPGPIRFEWRRSYSSNLDIDTGHGPGWITPLSQRLVIEANKVILTNEHGRSIEFKLPAIGASCHHRQEKLLLKRQAEHSYLLSTTGMDDLKLFRADGVSDYLPLVEFRDGFGNSISIDYKRGQVQKLITSWGHSLKFEHTDRGQIKSIHSFDLSDDANPNGLLCQYGYSEDDCLIEATDLSRCGECYSYQQQLISTRETQNGQSWHYSRRDESLPARYCLAKCLETGETYKLNWRNQKRQVELNRGNSDSWFYTLDNLGQIRQVTLPNGNTIRRLFDSYGNLCCESNGEDQAYYFRYNRSGQVTRITDSLNRSTRIRYSEDGQPTLITDALNNHWQRRYGSAGELLELRSPSGKTWQLNYSNKGQLEQLINPDLAIIEFQWDSQFNLLQVTDAEHNTTRFEHDHWHRLEKIIDPCNSTHEFRYDERGLLSSLTLPSQVRFELHYDQAGQLTELTSSDGQRTQYEYQYGLLTATTDRFGRCEFNYDEYCRLIRATNAAGLHFILRYNGNGRIVEETDFQKRSYRYEYNKAEQLIEYRDPEVITTLERDLAGQLIKASNNSGDTREFHFDALGRLIAANNRDALVRYQYDNDGQLTSEHVDDQEFSSYSFKHHYDGCGRRIKTIADEVLIQYQYSPNGNLFGIDINGESALRRIYDACNRVTEQTQGELKSEFNYSEFGNLITHTVTQSGKAKPLIDRQYEYNQHGHLSAMNDAGFGRCQFQYTALGQLYCCDGVFAEQLEYSERNQLISSNGVPLQYSDTEQLTQLGDMSIQHDKRGNMTYRSAGTQHPNSVIYNYTGWDQLSSIENGDFKTFYRYDALGRRLSKVVTHLKTKQQKKGSFKHNGDQLWSDIQLTPRGERTQNYLLTPDTSEPVAVTHDGSLYAIHLDNSGYCCEITDHKGSIVWKNQARLLGGANRFSEKPVITNPLRGVGLYSDSESGLNYFWLNGQSIYRDTLSASPLSAQKYPSLGPLSLHQGIAFPQVANTLPFEMNNLSSFSLSECQLASDITDTIHLVKG